MREGLVARVQQAIATQRLFPPRSRILVAVSGGADSVALLHILILLQSSWKWSLRIAHLDHGLREGSAVDAAFVEQLAERWRIPATVGAKDVQSICSKEGWSLEDGARRIRYRFLSETADKYSMGHVALAHTADDQAETVLMRLLRGAGLLGLCAIPYRRRQENVSIVRPLLEIWREEIEAFLQSERISHREDPSNQETRFLRNRIRHELLPLLARDYNPKIKFALTQLAEQSAVDYAFLEAAAQRQWKRLSRVCGQAGVSLDIATFRKQPASIQRLLLRQAIKSVRGDLNRVEYRHWIEASRLFGRCPIGTIVDLPGGVQLVREKARILCRLKEGLSPAVTAASL